MTARRRTRRVRVFAASATPEAVAATEAGEWLTYRWGCAPDGYVTRRQLGALGLCPGGRRPGAEIRWGRGFKRVAYLYRVADARPKRVPSAAQLAALGKAMAARRTCTRCGRDVGYCVPTSTRECVDCMFPVSGLVAGTDRAWGAPTATQWAGEAA
ncbi:hypothetical protein CLV92_12218 [Kineococcus xinjiangensis]|uniref:Uncharacterized protein n=1 Tax=Kineococcus xinjiangensis TaxID=512762 RepID=A0A2S6IC87_9ACTN|nr:RRQRL motif-containing zinc-binding protein [Kineococcus xinjiangensis]PPK90843.1 hypothetical protein CLV92_12218 [Kineococcus xinjiangensis]